MPTRSVETSIRMTPQGKAELEELAAHMRISQAAVIETAVRKLYQEEKRTMNKERFDFSIADASSKPYAWMVDGVDKEDVREMGTEQYVEEYARTAINATNYSDGESDEDVYRRWREDTWEYDQAVAWINGWLTE